MKPYKTERSCISGAQLDPAPRAKAAGYIRVSTDEQVRGGVSLDAQEERIRAYCAMAGVDLVCIIREEGVSGTKHLDSRVGGKQLVSLVAWKKVEHVVALKLDRIFRDAEDALRQTKTWDKAGVALHLVDMGGQTLNTASAMGRFFLNMMAGFAELERNLIAERTAAALAFKKDHRQAYSPTPFGFDRGGVDLIENTGELATIQQMKTWHAEGWSLRHIADELTAGGVPTKNGGRRWYRMHLVSRDLAPGTVNLRLGAVRRLAYEAADCGLLSADLAAGIWRIKSRKNWEYGLATG
jgi:DNA invertase Pin-like site-specific DNA recombinase